MPGYVKEPWSNSFILLKYYYTMSYNKENKKPWNIVMLSTIRSLLSL